MRPSPVIPEPLRLAYRPGRPLVLGPGARVIVDPAPAAVATAVLMASHLGEVGGFPVEVLEQDDGLPGAVVLRLADRADLGLPEGLSPALAAEAYRLQVTADRAVVTATAPAGLNRGAATLYQLAHAEPSTGPLTIPAVVVVDHPRFAWRGLTLDLARHFFDLDVLKRVVDVLVLYKLNHLHLHLSDDQGWRLQIPSRPELTERSGETAVDGDPAGFLTAQDYADLVAYATSCGVTIVPELDVPGHVHAALHADGDLNPSGRPPPPYTGVGGGFSSLDLDLPATAPFLRDVFADVAAMTPGPYVHVGGDPVPTMPADEYEQLLAIAVEQITAAGKTVVGWQDVAGALPASALDGAALQYWDERTTTGAVAAAVARGAHVLVSPTATTALDRGPDGTGGPAAGRRGALGLRDSYEWDPLDVVPGIDPARVVGVSACLWTETVRTTTDLFFLLLPRLLAISEVAWSAPERRSWTGFADRLPHHARVWDRQRLSWFRSPEVDW